MASLTRRTWVWVNSGSWRWTGKPGVHGVANGCTQLSDWSELREPGAMILVFWRLSFKPALWKKAFRLHHGIFSSSSCSAIRGVSPAYLRFLIFPQTISIPACDSSSLAFCLMCHAYKGVPGGSDGKESAYNAGDMGSIPGLGISPGEGNGYLLRYSCLENSTDRGARRATVHGVAKSWTWVSN